MTLKVEFFFSRQIRSDIWNSFKFYESGEQMGLIHEKNQRSKFLRKCPFNRAKWNFDIDNVWCRRRSVDRGKILHPPAAVIVLRHPFLMLEFDNFPHGSANSSTYCIYKYIYICTSTFFLYNESSIIYPWAPLYIHPPSTKKTLCQQM